MSRFEGVPAHDIEYVHESLGAPVPAGLTSRERHLAWCKERALEYVDAGDLQNAWASMVSDLNKHPETQGHEGVQLGMMLLMGGFLSTPREMREHIEGFN